MPKKHKAKQYNLYGVSHKVYKTIREDPQAIIIRKIRRPVVGVCDYENDTISIDYRGEILSTLIHECLHKWYPDKSEGWVISQEKKIMNNITQKQAKNLLRALLMVI